MPSRSARASALASAWVIVPLLQQSHWAARNQILEGTGLENGYGAGQMLSWLFTGHLYDDGRWPVVTVLVAVGIGVCMARWRSFLAGRALIVIWVVTLLMTFGRTTFGPLYDVLPGSSDIFIRRFQMGVQLSGILLAGIALVFLGRLILDGALAQVPEERRGWAARPAGRGVVAGLCIVALVLVLAPGLERHGHLRRPQRDEHRPASSGRRTGGTRRSTELLDYVRAHPRGRVYAGAPTNWGNDFLVGAVPVFKYLESKDVDEVGYTLRTASLMTDPEYFFDETNPGDYPLFGIGYIIMPVDMAAPVEADKVGCSGDYCLWALPQSGYIHVYDTTGTLTATRADVGSQSTTLLASPLLERAARPHRRFQRAGGVRPHRGRCVGAARVAGACGDGAGRSRERHGPGRGAHDTEGHRGAQRLLRPGLARHGERQSRRPRSWWRRRWSVSSWARVCTRWCSPTTATGPTARCSSWRSWSSWEQPLHPWSGAGRDRRGSGGTGTMEGDDDTPQP